MKESWEGTRSLPDSSAVLESVLSLRERAAIDPFDEVQLAEVIRTCRQSDSLSDAGRKLFSASRTKKKSKNDADRLKKYLSRFGLEWSRVR